MKIFQKLSHLFKTPEKIQYGIPYTIKVIECIGKAKIPTTLFGPPQSLTSNKSKSMLNSGLLGCAGIASFQTKAEALQFAINFTATDTDNGTKANYEAAQELFDFICKNVKLPDIKGDASEKFYEQAVGMLAALKPKPEPEKCKDSSNSCDSGIEISLHNPVWGEPDIPRSKPE